MKFAALLLLLPGLAGLILSAVISTRYVDTMPQSPMPGENRVVPRGIDGATIYQTPEEDRRLTLIEFGSVGVFAAGLALSLVYLERWGREQAQEDEGEGELAGRLT